jgi:hypothetical protein
MPARTMKIKSHSEAHVVVLEDGSTWQLFPGDLNITLGWRPDTDITVKVIEDDVCSHMLVSDCGPVRAIRGGERWPAPVVRSVLKGG